MRYRYEDHRTIYISYSQYTFEMTNRALSMFVLLLVVGTGLAEVDKLRIDGIEPDAGPLSGKNAVKTLQAAQE